MCTYVATYYDYYDKGKDTNFRVIVTRLDRIVKILKVKNNIQAAT